MVAKAEKGGSLFINRGESIAVPVFFGYNEKKGTIDCVMDGQEKAADRCCFRTKRECLFGAIGGHRWYGSSTVLEEIETTRCFIFWQNRNVCCFLQCLSTIFSIRWKNPVTGRVDYTGKEEKSGGARFQNEMERKFAMMKKRMTLFFVLLWCVSLCTPAFALDTAMEEEPVPVFLRLQDGQGKEYVFDPQPHALWLGHYDRTEEVLTLEDIASCMPSSVETEITVSNQSDAEGCYLIVHSAMYSPLTKAAAGWYVKDARSDNLTVVDGDTVYMGGPRWGEDYLCAGGIWRSAMEDAQGDVLRIDAGESITFRLPDDAEAEDFCRLYVDVFTPLASGEEQMSRLCYDLLLNQRGADAEAATDISARTFGNWTEMPVNACCPYHSFGGRAEQCRWYRQYGSVRSGHHWDHCTEAMDEQRYGHHKAYGDSMWCL